MDFEDVIATKMQEVMSKLQVLFLRPLKPAIVGFCVDIASVGAVEIEKQIEFVDLD